VPSLSSNSVTALPHHRSTMNGFTLSLEPMVCTSAGSSKQPPVFILPRRPLPW
jgi:hypothetical protein